MIKIIMTISTLLLSSTAAFAGSHYEDTLAMYEAGHRLLTWR